MRLLHVKLSSCSFAGPFFVAVFADSASMPLAGHNSCAVCSAAFDSMGI